MPASPRVSWQTVPRPLAPLVGPRKVGNYYWNLEIAI